LKKNVFKICSKSLILFLESLAIILLICFAGAGFLAWKISQDPLSLDFAQNTIETALENESDLYQVEIGQSFLHWPDRKGPLLIGLRDVVLRQVSQQASEIKIEKIDLDISYQALLLGKIRPVSLIIQEPSIVLIKDEKGIGLFFENKKIVEKEEQQTNILQEIISTFEKLSAPEKNGFGFLKNLDEIKILNAKIDVEDIVAQKAYSFSNINAALKADKDMTALEVTGALDRFYDLTQDLNSSDKTGENGFLDISFFYDTEIKKLTHSFDFKNIQISPYLNLLMSEANEITMDGFLSGTVKMEISPEARIQNGEMVLESENVRFEYPAEFTNPVQIKSFILSGFYDGEKNTGFLENLSAQINGANIDVSGEITRLSENEFLFPLNLKSQRVSHEVLSGLFPKSTSDTDAYEWIVQKISGGVFSNVDFSTQLTLKKEGDDTGWTVATNNSRVAFTCENTTIDYSPPFAPAENVTGQGVVDLGKDEIQVKAQKGTIGGLDLTDADLFFKDISVVGGGWADLKFNATGPLKNLFEILAKEPINMAEDFTFDIAKVKGRITEMQARIQFPTVKDLPKDKVEVDVTGVINDAFLPAIVDGLDLSGGPFNVKVGEGQYSVKGRGALQDQPVTLDYMEYIDSSNRDYEAQAKAEIVLTQALRKHFGIGLEDYISGDLPVNLVYTEYPNDDAAISVKGDIAPLRLSIDEFDYTKPAGVNGDLSLEAVIDNGNIAEVRKLSLNSQGLDLKDGHLFFGDLQGKKGELRRGILPSVKLGKSDLNVEFEITDQNVLKVIAQGPYMDASPFLKSSLDETNKTVASSETGQPIIASLKADTLLTKNDRFISNAKIYLETDQDGDLTRLEMDGLVGKGDIYLRFKPDENGLRTFRLEASDAGAALYAADLYDNARGGSLLIYGEPKGNDLTGDLYGSARIENFSVVRAPVLAQLLNTLSLGGILQQLQGQDGLFFSKLESGFEWQFRPNGNLLVIKEGRTTGSSIGLTFDGVMNQETDTIDVSGTIVPMSELNSLIGSIPIIGDLLTGGGALIAATYSMKGPSNDPQVSVNPLSVLTPGIIRKILFEGGYERKIPVRNAPANPDE
jgi:hypothetical protein